MDIRTAGDMLDLVSNLSLSDIAEEALQNTTEQALALNKDQLLHGKQSDGQPIRDYVLHSYAMLKHDMNPLPGFGIPDYRLTGAYYNAFIATADSDGLHVYNTDPKAPYLEQRTSGDGNQQEGADLIAGLDDENHNMYVAETYEPEFMEIVHRDLKMI